MNKELALVVDASIQLELNVADLYTLFHEIFPPHASFWWKLCLEENNHAAMLRAAKEQFEPIGKFPAQLFSGKLEDIVNCNNTITGLISKYEASPPSETEAFNIALELEQSAGELHYQEFMENASAMDKVFQRLNADDKDHAERIRDYMERRGIAFIEPCPLAQTSHL